MTTARVLEVIAVDQGLKRLFPPQCQVVAGPALRVLVWRSSTASLLHTKPNKGNGSS